MVEPYEVYTKGWRGFTRLIVQQRGTHPGCPAGETAVGMLPNGSRGHCDVAVVACVAVP